MQAGLPGPGMVTRCLHHGWVVGDYSSLSPATATGPLPVYWSCSKHTLPNVFSCSHTWTLLFPRGLCMHSVSQAALPYHLSSPYPHARWLPARGSQWLGGVGTLGHCSHMEEWEAPKKKAIDASECA